MEPVEKHLGNFGIYQARFLAMLSIPAILGSLPLLLLTFSAAVPENRCCNPSIENCDGSELFHISQFSDQNLRRRWFYHDNKTHSTSVCRYCPNAQNGTCTFDNSRTCDHGHVYDKSQYKSTLTELFTMVCEDAWKIDLLKSSFMVGVLLGAATWGITSDRIGRRPVYIICSLLQIPTYLLQPFIANYILLCFLCAINGALQTGCFLAGFITFTEMVNGSWRTVGSMLIQAFYSIGYFVVGAMAYFIRDWKTLTFATLSSVLLYIPTAWFFPESIRWLILHGKIEEAEKRLETVIKCNRNLVPGVRFADGPINANGSKGKRATVLDLFKHASLAKVTLVLFVMWFVTAMSYYGLSLNTNDLPGDQYLNFVLSGVVEIPAYALTIPLLEKWGRKPSLILLMFASGACCISSGLLLMVKVNPILSSALSIAGKMAITGVFGTVYVLTAEIFPTVVRNAGTGLCSFSGRIGSILSPQIHLLAFYAIAALPNIIYGSFSLLATLLAFLLPETVNQAMPESIADGIRISRPSSMADTRPLLDPEDDREELYSKN